MNPVVKNILAIIAGIIVGSLVNMAIIMIGMFIIPAPDGVDPWDPESIKANMDAFTHIHFIFPFLAHAVGTLVGAFVAAKIAANNKFKIAMVVGAIFLVFGVINLMSLSGPMWFNVVDAVGAYIPMGYLGGKWATKN